MPPHHIFITGGTGYLGVRLIPLLQERGHAVHALVRDGSEKKLPAGCPYVFGDALGKTSYAHQIAPADTFVQLVGVAHPSPGKADQFLAIDLPSGRAAIAAAKQTGVKHFVYVSVAHDAPTMKAYVDVRVECERLIRESGMNATILRPLYVVGPGHYWPLLIRPLIWLVEQIPAMREKMQRFALVTLSQMLRALVFAIENPCKGIRILEVPQIRSL